MNFVREDRLMKRKVCRIFINAIMLLAVTLILGCKSYADDLTPFIDTLSGHSIQRLSANEAVFRIGTAPTHVYVKENTYNEEALLGTLYYAITDTDEYPEVGSEEWTSYGSVNGKHVYINTLELQPGPCYVHWVVEDYDTQDTKYSNVLTDYIPCNGYFFDDFEAYPEKTKTKNESILPVSHYAGAQYNYGSYVEYLSSKTLNVLSYNDSYNGSTGEQIEFPMNMGTKFEVNFDMYWDNFAGEFGIKDDSGYMAYVSINYSSYNAKTIRSSSNIEFGEVEKSTWHHFKLIMDTVTGEYDFYDNGIKVNEEILVGDTNRLPKYLYFYAKKGGVPTNISSSFIDNIEIKTISEKPVMHGGSIYRDGENAKIYVYAGGTGDVYYIEGNENSDFSDEYITENGNYINDAISVGGLNCINITDLSDGEVTLYMVMKNSFGVLSDVKKISLPYDVYIYEDNEAYPLSYAPESVEVRYCGGNVQLDASDTSNKAYGFAGGNGTYAEYHSRERILLPEYTVVQNKTLLVLEADFIPTHRSPGQIFLGKRGETKKEFGVTSPGIDFNGEYISSFGAKEKHTSNVKREYNHKYHIKLVYDAYSKLFDYYIDGVLQNSKPLDAVTANDDPAVAFDPGSIELHASPNSGSQIDNVSFAIEEGYLHHHVYEGNTCQRKCTICNKIFPMFKHDYEDSIITPVNECKDGEKKLVCKDCGYIKKVTEIIHTDNLDDDGVANGDYAQNLNNSKIVTIPGATKLHVTVEGITQKDYDYLKIWEGKQKYSPSDNKGNPIYLTGYFYGEEKKEYDIEGDSVTFGFHSNGDTQNYGFCAYIEADFDEVITIKSSQPHDYTGKQYLPGEEGHYRICNVCNERSAEETCTFTEERMAREATCGDDGYYVKTCSLCGRDYEKTIKYSHTSNVSDDKAQNGNYDDGLNYSEVISIPGALKIKISIEGTTESNYDYLYIWEGNHPDYLPSKNGDSDGFIASISGNLNGKTYEIEGDSVTFGFSSDSSTGKYGYFATIESIDTERVILATGNHDYTNCAYSKNAYTHCKVCNVCNHPAQEEPHKLTIEEIITDPTCVESGKKKLKCSVCGEYGKPTLTVHSSNVDDAGNNNSNYSNFADEASAVEFPGASSLHIKINGSTESGYDYVYVINGYYPNGLDGISDYTTVKTLHGAFGEQEFDIEGDSVTFRLTSDSSNGDYGYYAYVTSSQYELDIPATGVHDYEGQPYQTDIKGYHYQKCKICDGDSEKIECTPSDKVIENNVASSCDKDGTYDEVVYCSICKQELSREKVKSPMTGSHVPIEKIIPATFTTDGKITTFCKICNKEIKKAVIISKPAEPSLSNDVFAYTGKQIKPAINIVDANGMAIPQKYYTISYGTNKKIGKGTVQITFNGLYSGKKDISFSIGPKGTSISKLTPKKGGFDIKWKKQTSQTSGYQIEYSLSDTFKGKKVITIKKNKETKASAKKLKSGKKYYVRIRTYTKAGSKKYYSPWSKVKKVTVKK